MGKTVRVSDHSFRELQLLGEERQLVDGYLEVVAAFEKLQKLVAPSEEDNAIGILNALFRGEHLTPLTDNPDEWKYFGEDYSGDTRGVWQNQRNRNAFSNDAGKSYYLLRKNGKATGFPVKIRNSISYVAEVVEDE